MTDREQLEDGDRGPRDARGGDAPGGDAPDSDAPDSDPPGDRTRSDDLRALPESRSQTLLGSEPTDLADSLVESSEPASGRRSSHASSSTSHARSRLLDLGPTTGDRLGDYALEQRLGTGGMGDVFAARHVQTGERVALKILSTTTATRLYRFKREFRALTDLSHDNLIRLHTLVVPEQGSPYFTMELLDGEHFVRWVRGSTPPGEAPDPERLEHGLRQLVEGVHYLHTRHYIHRDLKPANVLVTTAGRVVVLDFGLVSELSAADGGVTRDRQILGTPSFMAPEQATGQRVGAPADYYAIGVMLFSCMTGRLPYEGSAIQQLVAKQNTPPDPGEGVEGLPDELRTLCMRLLSRDPEARPGGRELLEYLRASETPTSSPAPIFVGRTEELAALHEALGEVGRRRAPVIVHLRGRSGDGKSALMNRFRAELQDTEAIVLHGRCREREAVPYKGIDAVVDALSAYLRQLPSDERQQLYPADLDALIRLFPVLDEIWEPPQSLPLELNEVRSLGASTLRKLLSALADPRPLVVHVDDFQWADQDSISLLSALVRPPEAPALLLVLSYRSETSESEALRKLVTHEILAGPGTRTIELGALSAADAQALAAELLRAEGPADPEPRQARAETIALRSRGSPFFIAQMALGGSALDTSDSNLDQIMVRRLSDLDGDAQRLLELVAAFGRPLPTRLALELCAPATEATLDALGELGLLVRDEGRGDDDDRVEAAHDRVREGVLEAMATEDRTRLHRRIGEHLLAHHAGDPPGEEIFAVVNQLDAGMPPLGTLPAAQRLELAKLNHRAGQRALESTAWIAAQRYLDSAYELVEPWLPEARQGRGHYDLCVAVALGRAQVEFALENSEGDAAIHDLLGWSLSTEDYCRIAQWYCWNLSLRARLAECVHFGLDALEHIGLPAPRRPSWLRALWSYARGWRSVWKTGPTQVRALPPIEDTRIRAGMDILAAAGTYSMMFDVKLHLALAGLHGRLLARYGFHDGAGVALSALAMSAAARGKVQQARELCEAVHNFADDRTLSTFAQYGPQAIVVSVLNTVYPMDQVLAIDHKIYERAAEVAPQTLVEAIGMTCASNRCSASISLPALVDFLDAFAARHDGFKLSWVTYLASSCRHYARSLIQGQTEAQSSQSMISLYDGPAEIAVIATASVTVMQIEVAVLLGDPEHAWSLVGTLVRNYERTIGTLWHAPSYAMISTIVMAERWARSSAAERRRMKRAMRRFRSTARRWAERCPENYQPMLDIVEGERAALANRYDDAVTSYERARTAATTHGTTRLLGLASERLALLAKRRGQSLVANAAFAAAREAYEAWGATAVVRRLDQDWTTPSQERASLTE
ncbi:MAG: protein kinase [Myxococcota bacterium]